jgi:hypothetical protein
MASDARGMTADPIPCYQCGADARTPLGVATVRIQIGGDWQLSPICPACWTQRLPPPRPQVPQERDA